MFDFIIVVAGLLVPLFVVIYWISRYFGGGKGKKGRH
jgi:hypothetical protein